MPQSGIDIEELDPTIRPQDDLFGHANRRWLESTPIPPDKADVATFTVLRDRAEEAVHTLIHSCAAGTTTGPLAQQVGHLYTSFMDCSTIEAAGFTPIAAEIEQILATSTIEEALLCSAQLQRTLSDGVFSAFVANDPGDPTRYLLQLVQGGLGLPDESYYRGTHFAPQRQAYQAYISDMLALIGYEDSEGAGERVLDLETQLASHHWDMVTLRDPQKRYNLLTTEQANQLLPPLEAWLTALGVQKHQREELVILTPPFFEGLGALMHNSSLRQWQEWLLTRLLVPTSPYLSEQFVARNFDFYGHVLTGAEQIRERWKRGVATVEAHLGEAVGQLYIAAHFPPAHKSAMDTLVDYLMDAYRESISSLTWLSEETKTAALTKLGKFTPKIGYPEQWRDYSSIDITATDLLGNLRECALDELAYQLRKIGQPIDRAEWLMTPQTVNAYYYPVMNEIVFPAAILQPPLFNITADPATNFGAIGAVIGHEIGHGFDDQGSQYDGDGALRNWWTDKDRQAFEERTRELVEQYSALSPLAAPETKINGELTLGENIGDLGGLAIAYRAWQLSLAGKEPEVIDGLSGTERFFLSYALAWRGKSRPEQAVKRAATDPHSPAEWRCNQVVKNIDAFHDTFNTAAGDRLWLDPDRRVRIW